MGAAVKEGVREVICGGKSGVVWRFTVEQEEEVSDTESQKHSVWIILVSV